MGTCPLLLLFFLHSRGQFPTHVPGVRVSRGVQEHGWEMVGVAFVVVVVVVVVAVAVVGVVVVFVVVAFLI